ncbi:tautomerase family protein [Roseomonas populi]|uniref:Tautomerase family protein n=1 Tax=Roseomonas populi TaxID=3121582 RepID=A0ABT1WZ47_9PROT|nr:tautomerase family protein [Roseomonas pecuniae]MCR0981125.1 tautomerase family protein [Roseomonas pecuniae]
MPHVVVKLYAGRSEQQKARIAELVAQAIIDGAGSSEGSVSVAIEDVQPDQWTAEVYEPDIQGRQDKLYKMPGYGPLAGVPLPSR